MASKGAQVVVVGSGATGGWVCKVLTEAGVDVLLLEAGSSPETTKCPPHLWYELEGRAEPPASASPRQPIQSRDAAFRESNAHLWVDDADNPYSSPKDKPFIWMRSRSAGGRSNLWAGQSWRISPDEFEAPDRDGHGIGWPLSYEELVEDYEAVERLHRLTGQPDPTGAVPHMLLDGPASLSDAEARLATQVSMRWDHPSTATRCVNQRCEGGAVSGQWPLASSLGSTLPAALATGRLSTVYNATVSRLRLAPGGQRVAAVEYLDTTNGHEHAIEASAFVLCASTIESTRILLNSDAGRHGQGLGNSSGTLGRFLMDHTSTCALGRVPDGDRTPGAILCDGANGLFLPAFETALGDQDFLRSYSVWISLGKPAGNGVDALFLAVGEMLPDPDNRVILDSRRTDRWGIPIPRIECAFGENDRRMQEHQKRSLHALADAAGVELVMPPLEGIPGGMIHEVGTARMGRSAATSYCNGFTQSWEVPNLFVPDGACWSTSAYQSPTLTMMAIARRCARFIARGLGSSGGNERSEPMTAGNETI